MQDRLAVGVRPPPRHARNAQLAAGGQAILAGIVCRLVGVVHRPAGRRVEGELRAVGARGPAQLDIHGAHLRSVQRAQPREHRQHAVLAIQACVQRELLYVQGPAALESHRSPGTHGRRSGRDPGQPAEQHRAKEAQVAVGNQPRAPAGARAAAHIQQWAERAAADRQLVARLQPSCHVERVRREHRVALEHQLAVQVDLGHGRDSVQAQAHLFVSSDRLRVEARAKPPILGVEIARIARAPVARVAQDCGRRTGHARGQPRELVERGRIGMGLGPAPGGLPTVAEHKLVVTLHADARGRRARRWFRGAHICSHAHRHPSMLSNPPRKDARAFARLRPPQRPPIDYLGNHAGPTGAERWPARPRRRGTPMSGQHVTRQGGRR